MQQVEGWIVTMYYLMYLVQMKPLILCTTLVIFCEVCKTYQVVRKW